MDEVVFYIDGIPTKKVSLNTDDKNTIYTQVLEVNDSNHFYPTHFEIHTTYAAARIMYLGLVSAASYENGNKNAIKPNGIDNIFVLGAKSAYKNR